jgi:hypothetical protein
MASGFGVDPTKDGNGVITSGTTSSDIQSVWGGLYTPGIVSGCAVATSSSAMTYSVSSGVVMIPTATGQVIPAPVPATVVATSAAPSGGSRTDIVYAQQRFPSIEGDSNVIVGVGQSLPARAVLLQQYNVTANLTSTSGATVIGDTTYSLPYGGGLGILHQWTDTFSGVHNQNNLRLGVGTITLPTDRLIRFSVTSLLYASGATGFDNSKYCEWYTHPELDYVALTRWGSPGLHQAWATYTWESYFTVSAGTHTVSYSRGRIIGPGSVATQYGVANGGILYPGTVFTVQDAGVVA